MNSRNARAAWLAVALLLAVGLGSAGVARADRLDGANHGGRPFATDLTGAAEAPDPGDPDGSGTAVLTMNPGQGEVCFELTVADIALPASAAHIHIAPVGVPGPVVVPLTAPDASGGSAGCVTDVDRGLILDIFRNPEGYYVNVHNGDFGAGAVRGQLG